MNESTSVRGSTPASAYARDAASNMSSFQLYSGVAGRNAVIPIPMIPTRTSSLSAGRGPRGEDRESSKDCRVRKGLSSLRPFVEPDGVFLPLYYFDLETTGDDPQLDRIVTAQYQTFTDDLVPMGTFQVIAEWEWGEKQLIQMVLEKGILEPTWDFVPIGNRLRFDVTFLIERATKWKLVDWDMAKLKYYWFTKPYLDIAPILVMLNRGAFEGSSLGRFADKESGARVPKMYREGRYADIIDYVTRERDALVDVLKESREVLAALGDRRRRTPGPVGAKP